jgi:hypothetical protein
VLASMHRVDKAAEGTPGLYRLVGLAMWESAEAFQASAERIFQLVADGPWDQWCERPTDVFHPTKP